MHNEYSPLMFAIRYNSNTEVTTALIKAGADVNVKNENENTPLMWAARYNSSPEVAKGMNVCTEV